MHEFFTGLVEVVVSNIAWIALLVSIVIVVGLFGGIFRGKYRWIWRSGMGVVVIIAVMFCSNLFASFITPYVDNQLGKASRAEVGHEDPQTAEAIEDLLTGPLGQEKWEEETGFLVHTREYATSEGKVTIRRYLFTTVAEVETAKAIWKSTSFMMQNSADIVYK